MSVKYSTALRNAMFSRVPALRGATIGPVDTIAAVNGSPDTFTDSGTGFITAGFQVGDVVVVSGFATAVNNGIFTLTIVAAGTLSVSETVVVNESVGVHVKIQCIAGGSFKDIFKNCVLKIYSGSQPSDADQAVTGTLLCTISVGSGAFVAGAPANGLDFGDAAAAVISKDSTQTWSGSNAASGVAGWFRICANPSDAGALDTTTYCRIDGSVGTSGATLNLASTTLTSGVTTTIDSAAFTFPVGP